MEIHMQVINFNQNWILTKKGSSPKPVTLPYDAMIHEERVPDTAGGSGHGYFPGGIYEYTRQFDAPLDWQEKCVSFLFEGVYQNATVYINGTPAYTRPNGYVPFVVPADAFLHYGQTNEIKVVADNHALPNSRWYTGSGIYRPVSLLIAEQSHIVWEGVQITTLSYRNPQIRVCTRATDGDVFVEILDKGTVLASASGADVTIPLPNARLWSEEQPYLYDCHVTLKKDGQITDEVTEHFGIRMIEWSNQGLFINGKETLLRGGCVHHDNGILGSASFAKSEERRVRIMKEAGFNAIRSAHNLCSKAMLDACDKYGMYLMDETFDTWYMGKNPYDYHLHFDKWWQEDTKAMVLRDYNHPSVILYSIGNEVAEPCEENGVEAGRSQVDYIHSLDKSRPVTCGTNLMIVARAADGNGIYQDADSNNEKQKNASNMEVKGNASLMFNIIATFIGTGMNKAANSDKADKINSPFLDCLDIAGYNYASGRYIMDGKKHPERIIFGSETFPQDIAKNWEMVKKYPYLVGDFMWAGWDYLGESGIGAWSYNGGLPFARPYPWVLAGSGVIDINGVPDASCRYAATVWGKADTPVIGVKPVNHPGERPTKSVWRGTNAIESWSWKNCDGNKAEVEVYADAAYVELFLNGKRIGRKKIKQYKAIFKTRYQSGILEAAAYDKTGREIGRNRLVSAAGDYHVAVRPEEECISVNDIVYVNINIEGENNIIESNYDRDLTVSVTGGELLALGSAIPCTAQRYDSPTFCTYHGRLLAVLRAASAGTMKISVNGKDIRCGEAQIRVRE